MKIDFDEEKHEYRVNGVKVPSVSDILAPLSAMRYGDLNPAMLQAAAARGTAVHEACEAIDYGLDPEIDPEIAPYILAYQKFLRDYDVEWEMIEQIVYWQDPSKKDPLPSYCGTVDRFGYIDRKPSVVDIKTYSSMTTESQIAASCQTALYKQAVDEMQEGGWQRDRKTRRYILHLKKDGEYRLIDLDRFDEARGFDGEVIAGVCLGLYERVSAAKRQKKGKK